MIFLFALNRSAFDPNPEFTYQEHSEKELIEQRIQVHRALRRKHRMKRVFISSLRFVGYVRRGVVPQSFTRWK